MNFRIHFLLISGFSILIGESLPVDDIKKDVQKFIAAGGATFTRHALKLSKDGLLGQTELSLVWKGTFKGETDIAIKINSNQYMFDDEVKGFVALNATNDDNIESRGIPRVYFSGIFMIQYYAIAMTLFHGTLVDRMREQRKQNKNISELSILLIFRRMVEILEYLNEKKVIHNDIKPGNIFLRGSDVFLSDFNLASLDDGVDARGRTRDFASSNFYLNKKRVAMDDLESLVFSLWNVAGIPWDIPPDFFGKPEPEGQTLATCKQDGTAKEKMMEKSMQFKDPNVQWAFRVICAEEMLKEKSVPDYKLIVRILTDAITTMHGNSGTPRFEWLTGASSSSA